MAISNQETNKKINRLKIEIIKLEGRNLISELVNKLAYMNLKWERSRQIEISDIYDFDVDSGMRGLVRKTHMASVIHILL